MSRFRLFSDFPTLALSVSLLASTLAACSSSPPPTIADVKKLEAEDRTFDALQMLIPMAQKGDAAAQYELAGFYHYGYVGANDYTKALKWYRASARQGYADAMVGLSVMYLGGQGVTKDPREAFVWLNLAAQYMGDKRALAKIKRIRDEIGRNFTKDDIAYAKAESLLLQPESSSVQPNEAESIDHLPDQLPPTDTTTTTAPMTSGPLLQNVPPETAPLSDIPLQNALPAPPTKPLSVPSSALPATTAVQPSTSLPTTTSPTPVPIVPPATTDPAPSSTDSSTDAPASTTQVDPVPKF